MFIGLDPSDEAVHRAVDDNSLERMRAKEERAPSEVLQQHDTAERFVGKGAVGGWRSKLTQEEVDAVEHVSRDGLSRWAIRPSSRRPSRAHGVRSPPA